MPDLMEVPYYHCNSNECWKNEFASSDGKSRYIVTYGKLPYYLQKEKGHTHGFQCTCKGFKFRHDCGHCKKAEKDHCGWMQFLHGSKPVEIGDQKFCPNCGDGVTSMNWAV